MTFDPRDQFDRPLFVYASDAVNGGCPLYKFADIPVVCFDDDGQIPVEFMATTSLQSPEGKEYEHQMRFYGNGSWAPGAGRLEKSAEAATLLLRADAALEAFFSLFPGLVKGQKSLSLRHLCARFITSMRVWNQTDGPAITDKWAEALANIQRRFPDDSAKIRWLEEHERELGNIEPTFYSATVGDREDLQAAGGDGQTASPATGRRTRTGAPVTAIPGYKRDQKKADAGDGKEEVILGLNRDLQAANVSLEFWKKEASRLSGEKECLR
jgi:hypothetical protein